MDHVRDTVIRVVLWCGIIVFVAVLGPRLHRELPLNDFIEYWSAERLFVSGHNPYSASEMLDVQHGAGWESPQPLMMFNPPWVLPLLAPLAGLPFRTAQISWLVASVALLFVSTILLWRYYGGMPDRALIASACALLFFPNPVALRMGQLAPVILFGLAGFLLCVRSKRFWLAGVALSTLGIKPHLLIPVAVVVVL